MKSVLPGRIASLARDLEKQGTLFALALVPLPQSVSPNEGALSRELNASTDSRADFLTELDFENTMAKAGIHTIQLLGPIRDAERHSGAPAFYNALDNHLTVNGSVLVGNVLSKDVLTWKPWSSAKR